MSSRVLVLSYGPPPYNSNVKVEGGGLRCYGLAKGLHEDGIDVTLAFSSVFIGDIPQKHGFIPLLTYNIANLDSLVTHYDTIIVSYCMGAITDSVVHNISPTQRLILDCNVPAYIEVSARASTEKIMEYRQFNNDMKSWNSALLRADAILCASEVQKTYYQGVLSALGKINPVSYDIDNIFVVPYGVFERGATEASLKPLIDLPENTIKLLWFGGVYPWFSINDLLRAVKEIHTNTPVSLVVVGAKNPNVVHPDFIRVYESYKSMIDSGDFEGIVFDIPWVSFADRFKWYDLADYILTISQEGMENKFSWRTRTVDFLSSDTPILTNGGDPLSDVLIKTGNAFKIDTKNLAQSISAQINNAVFDSSARVAIREKLQWKNTVKPLADYLKNAPEIVRQSLDLSKSRKDLLYYLMGAVQRNGVNGIAKIILRIVRQKLVSSSLLKMLSGDNKKYYFFSHQMDNSGAPHIILDILKSFNTNEAHLYYYGPVDEANLHRIKSAKYSSSEIFYKNSLPRLTKNSVVLLNTTAFTQDLIKKLFDKIDSGYLKNIVWYIHEDDPSEVLYTDIRDRLKTLIQSGKLQLVFPSKKIRDNYDKLLSTKSNLVPYNYKISKKYYRSISDFSTLNFTMVGTIHDFRKGHLSVLYAFIEFYKHYYKKSPGNYRDFTLTIVGLDGSFVSKMLIEHAGELDGRLKLVDRISHEECLKLVYKNNATICYSLREAFPLFVLEAMAMGHVLIRNDSSGYHEQLQGNGILVKTAHFGELVEAIEKLCSKESTGSKELALMSKNSVKIAKSYAYNNSYDKFKEMMNSH